jgi:fatty acid desaturase
VSDSNSESRPATRSPPRGTLERLSRQNLRALTARSDAKGLGRLGAHLGAVLLSGWAIGMSVGTPWLAPAILVHGILVVFLFAPLHESIHRTAFRSRWINDAVAFACGLVLLLPPRYFRAFHLEHHRYTQYPGRDPELATAPIDGVGRWLARASGVPYWLDRCRTLVRHALGRVDEPFIRPTERTAMIHEARLWLVLYAGAGLVSATAGSGYLLWYWLLPVVAGQPFLRLYLMAEHGGCPFVADMLVNSRTTRSNALVRFLTWNMPYHAEHHVMASVPFHALPAAHALLGRRVVHRADGYVQVHRQLRRSLAG